MGTCNSIRIAIAGIGNCASALVQGIYYYGKEKKEEGLVESGLMNPKIGKWGCGDLIVAAAFDIDSRKVGSPVGKAIFALPNCAHRFVQKMSFLGPTVMMGPILDGVAPHMKDYPASRSFRISDQPAVDVPAVLQEQKIDVLISYMPVGADQATRYYAEACLEAECAFVNCTPCFIASDPSWSERFRQAGLPVVGDDIKSQVGATIVHRNMARLFAERAVHLRQTYQLNVGGNTDFLNMLARDRLSSKKISKTNAVRSQISPSIEDDRISIGPSDYVSWQGDQKVAFIRLEGEGFGGAPIALEMRLSVQDSPNSAGIVIDAIRYAALAKHLGISGPVDEICAWLMKSPPCQMSDTEAKARAETFAKRKD